MKKAASTYDSRAAQRDTAHTADYITIDRARTMLAFIPADDRDIWVTVGMALHSEFSDAGFSLWDCWSQFAPNYDEKAAREVWRSFRRGPITIATLVHLAKTHGWRPDASPERVLPPPPPKAAPKPQKSNTGRYALELWLAADCSDHVVASHPYAKAKGIGWAAGAGRGVASGKVIGRRADCIIVPIRTIETGKVQAVQCINTEGEKQTFGPIRGGGLLLGNTLEKRRFRWFVCEGWASAVSTVFHHQQGDGFCAAAFGKSNLDAVARRIAEIHQPDEITILREVDA